MITRIITMIITILHAINPKNINIYIHIILNTLPEGDNKDKNNDNNNNTRYKHYINMRGKISPHIQTR